MNDPPNASADPAVAETETGVSKPILRSSYVPIMAVSSCWHLVQIIIQLETNGQWTSFLEAYPPKMVWYRETLRPGIVEKNIPELKENYQEWMNQVAQVVSTQTKVTK